LKKKKKREKEKKKEKFKNRISCQDENMYYLSPKGVLRISGECCEFIF